MIKIANVTDEEAEEKMGDGRVDMSGGTRQQTVCPKTKTTG